MTTEWKDLPTLPDVGAAQLEGWEIQRLNTAKPDLWSDWDGCAWVSHWSLRGRPRQPKMKKVKSLCWRYSDGDFAWRTEGIILAKPWVRVPSEDKMVEVPDDN
jgi:hypothetical protein